MRSLQAINVGMSEHCPTVVYLSSVYKHWTALNTHHKEISILTISFCIDNLWNIKDMLFKVFFFVHTWGDKIRYETVKEKWTRIGIKIFNAQKQIALTIRCARHFEIKLHVPWRASYHTVLGLYRLILLVHHLRNYKVRSGNVDCLSVCSPWLMSPESESNNLRRLMTKPTKWLCAERRLRSPWASAQSDQILRCALNG